MRILGIDPGLDITGYGLIEQKQSSLNVSEAGIIRTSNKDVLSIRLDKIYSQVRDIISSYHPDICVIEQLYAHYRHPMTSVLMGHARGVVLLCCSQNNVRMQEYPAKTSKRAVTGNGNASKLQVQRVVNRVLRLKDISRPLDITDALALCLTYVYHSGKENINREYSKQQHLQADFKTISKRNRCPFRRLNFQEQFKTCGKHPKAQLTGKAIIGADKK
jgi:crossover junction endodeoxyribonuclease RuvC